MEYKVEILSPAGDFDTLKSAICAGADAVYVGGEKFGARAYAKNFSIDELKEAIDYVHLYGKKLYLTVNTLIKEREFDELYTYLSPLYEHGLDAVIVQDVGVLQYIKAQFPDLSLHASTQMTVTNYISAKHLEDFGVERVVPARELSFYEIQKIRENTSLEIECFVHGALCYCYSGQCLLSSMIGGRSGNRGQCAQPCRLSYKIGVDRKPYDILSLKDLCTIEHIPELIESGITSFKIEGRMKQPSYVGLVTSMYRKYVDLYYAVGRDQFSVTKEDKQKLMEAFQRRGYTDGYYVRHNGKEMISLKRPKFKEVIQEPHIDIKLKEKINGKLILIPEEPATLKLSCRNVDIQVCGTKVEYATKQPINAERVSKQIKKTGNTPFEFEELQVELSAQVFIPIQALNDLRREGMALLQKELLKPYRRVSVDRLQKDAYIDLTYRDVDSFKCSDKKLTISVETTEQLLICVKHPRAERIYVEDALWSDASARHEIRECLQISKSMRPKIYFSMCRIYRSEAERFYDKHLGELIEAFDGVLVRNLESYLRVKESTVKLPIVLDASLYQWNKSAKSWWRRHDFTISTAPVELNNWELAELEIMDMEMIVYGYQPVMLSAGCVKKNTKGCDHKSEQSYLTDRYQSKNRVKNECTFCYNIIYNALPLNLFDQGKELSKLNPASFRIQFTNESAKEVKQILRFYDRMRKREKDIDLSGASYTRGHFKRGVK